MYKKITKKDINVFADISGDRNPVHLKEEFADDTVLGIKLFTEFGLQAPHQMSLAKSSQDTV